MGDTVYLYMYTSLCILIFLWLVSEMVYSMALIMARALAVYKSVFEFNTC